MVEPASCWQQKCTMLSLRSGNDLLQPAPLETKYGPSSRLALLVTRELDDALPRPFDGPNKLCVREEQGLIGQVGEWRSEPRAEKDLVPRAKSGEERRLFMVRRFDRGVDQLFPSARSRSRATYKGDKRVLRIARERMKPF